jgi:hypothetical protein
MSAKSNRFAMDLLTACAMTAIAISMGSNKALAVGPRVADTFTATTANMTPTGLGLRMQVIQWQDDAARTQAVETLAAGTDAATPLGKLPTVGYVWPDRSPVGYSLKYAHRVQQPDGGERITLVTDKPLGSYDFKGWSVAAPAVKNDAPYSVIELVLDGSGSGTGTMSLASEVSLDEQAGTVTLVERTPGLLVDVKRAAPRP